MICYYRVRVSIFPHLELFISKYIYEKVYFLTLFLRQRSLNFLFMGSHTVDLKRQAALLRRVLLLRGKNREKNTL